MPCHLSRRSFVQSAAAAAAAVAAKGLWGDLAFASDLHPSNLLSQFGYGDVSWRAICTNRSCTERILC